MRLRSHCQPCPCSQMPRVPLAGSGQRTVTRASPAADCRLRADSSESLELTRSWVSVGQLPEALIAIVEIQANRPKPAF